MNTPSFKNHGLNFTAIILASTLGYLLVLKTFWFHDDWYFLANAADMAPLNKGGSRWISYVAYWKLLYPVFGLNTYGWAITRLLLHGGSSWLVFRLAHRSGLKPGAALLAGFLFAASPVAFESLYWGTGVVEILGTFFTLASIERWLQGGTRNTILAALWGLLAIGSKEVGLFIPLFFMVHLVVRRDAAKPRWAAVVFLGIAALAAGLLLMNNLDGSREYSLSLVSIPKNVLMLFFWLVAPPNWQTGREVELPWTMAVGGVVLLAWLILSIRHQRRGNALGLQLLAIGLLTMGPAMILDNHIVPRYNYGPMAAWVICLAYFLQNYLPQPRKRWLVAAVFITVDLSHGNTYFHINNRYPEGRAKHRLVIKEEASRGLCNSLLHNKLKENDRLVFFLEADGDKDLSEKLMDAVGGPLGPQLFLGDGVQVRWTDKFTRADIGCYLVSVRDFKVKPVGRFQPK